MYHAVHFNGKEMMVDYTQYLKKHNIVYQAPAYRGYEGIPIGNGDMGGMLYHTEKSMVFGVNKTDVIDYGPDGNFKAWSWESEEKNTAPVSCGQITISDGMPSFDWIYLQKFQQTLSLAEGCVFAHSETPFSSFDYTVYAAKNPDVIVFEIDTASEEAIERRVSLEKWSSINLFHDYEQIKPEFGKNLFNISAGEKEGTVYLQQELQGTHYLIALRVVGCKSKPELHNRRTVELVLEKSKQCHFAVLATVIAEHGKTPDLNKAIQILDQAAADQRALFEHHTENWKNFWRKSFIHLESDDYLENIYYLNLYQLQSSSLGSKPLTFAGLWNWYKDTRNWGHFYHWNHQQTYWGIYSSNHPEFAQNYLQYRFEMLENAKKDARALFGSEKGAFYSDISNLNGFNSLEPDTVRNLTVGVQVAMDFYRYYQYTDDGDFLREKAYPVMKAAAELYCTLLKKDTDGYYRIQGGATAYESYWNLRETITDWSMIHALFSALLSSAPLTGLSKKEEEKYREILSHLYPLPTETVEVNGEKKELLSVGKKWDAHPVSIGEGDYPLSPFPMSQLAAVFPSGCIGLCQKGTPVFEAAQNTARVLFDQDVYDASKIGSSGHAIVTEAAARLGMREDCLPILRHFVEKYQVFPNGLTHFADIGSGQYWSSVYRPRVLESHPLFTDWEKVHEKTDGIRTHIPSDYFLHPYFESISNIMTGINEMLLQSYDGVIRVFPATPENYTAAFTLKAIHGYCVSAEEVEGDIRFIAIHSEHGGICRVENPWNKERVQITSSGNFLSYSDEKGVLQFQTEKGKDYIITRAEAPLAQYYQTPFSSTPNLAPKEWHGKILGKHKMLGI